MDAEMSPGESSNPNNNNNSNNNSSNPSTNPHHAFNATPDSGHKPSSSNNIERTSSSIADDSSNFDLGDDIGWYCSLCTFRNSADKFKCEMCDLRRGTSTRKPRCNAETIVAQVVKQQEQIRQQTRVKTPKSSRSATSTILNASSPSGSKIRTKTSKSSRAHTEVSDSEDHLSDTNSSPKKKKKHDTKAGSQKSKKLKQSNNSRPAKEDNDESTESEYSSSSDSSDTGSISVSSSSDATSESSLASTDSISSADESDVQESTKQDSYSAYSPYTMMNDRELDVKPIKRPVTTTSPIPQIKTPSDNPFKVTPLEVSGNLIKYSPPTSSGRTGLIIDKKRFTQHSVTVNDVTIIFTEFATRQNTYVRKKKKRRDGSRTKNGNVNSKSRSKSQPKSSNSASTAAEAP